MVKSLDPSNQPPANESRTEARRFARDTWEVRVFITGRRESGSLVGHADLYRDGAYRCRITTANDHHDERLAMNSLEARAHAWIDAWNSRDHSGDTGFASL